MAWKPSAAKSAVWASAIVCWLCRAEESSPIRCERHTARFKLSETAAHCMALSAMDQYGYLLNHLIAGSFLTADLTSSLPGNGSSGKVSILLPSTPVLAIQRSAAFLAGHLRHNFGVGGALCALPAAGSAKRCGRIVSVHAPTKEFPAEPIAEMTVDQLAGTQRRCG